MSGEPNPVDTTGLVRGDPVRWVDRETGRYVSATFVEYECDDAAWSWLTDADHPTPYLVPTDGLLPAAYRPGETVQYPADGTGEACYGAYVGPAANGGHDVRTAGGSVVTVYGRYLRRAGPADLLPDDRSDERKAVG